MAGMTATITPSSAREEFESFYSRWLVDQQGFLDQLILLSNLKGDVLEQGDVGRYMGTLIEAVLSHYERYYEEKAKAMIQENELGCSLVFFFSQQWATSLEKEILWMGGFKPSFALSLLGASVNDMSSEQKGRIEAVRQEVEAEEKAVERVSERISMWTPVEGDREGVVVREDVEEEMREVMRAADKVRRETVMKVVGSLRGRQTVKYLVAVGSYWLGMRGLGIIFPL